MDDGQIFCELADVDAILYTIDDESIKAALERGRGVRGNQYVDLRAPLNAERQLMRAGVRSMLRNLVYHRQKMISKGTCWELTSMMQMVCPTSFLKHRRWHVPRGSK